MSKYTNRQVAESFELWSEYVDPNAEMTREQFDAMSVEERETLVENAFGTDAEQAARSAV